MSGSSSDVTRLLGALISGDREAWNPLVESIYPELKRLAKRYISKEKKGLTIGPTELVHETFIVLDHYHSKGWKNRRHFFCAAATAMRRILVNLARKKAALKRGGHQRPVPLEGMEPPSPLSNNRLFEDVEMMNQALDKMMAVESLERPYTIVQLYFFLEMKQEQIAEELKVSTKTVYRDLEFAKAWLYREMRRSKNSHG